LPASGFTPPGSVAIQPSNSNHERKIT